MPRYKLTIEYDGTPFAGWQRQDNGRAVQQAIEEAMLRLSGEAVTIRGAGRTDAGVHAVGQIAHFDAAKTWTGGRLRDGLNAHLRPEPITILAAEEVAADFDARVSAKRRHYLYRILNRRTPAALDRERVWQVRTPLDLRAMQAAAASILGKHDFTTFRSADCQARSPVKTLDQLDLAREGEEIRVTSSARSFLHSQVRSLVGSLVEVGVGRWPVERMRQALDARDRAACGPLAPPHGLTLMRVDY